MERGKLAIALRPSVFNLRTILSIARSVDSSETVTHLFVPETSYSGFRSLEICSACLGVTNRLSVGTGVIRILEYDPRDLASRVFTLQSLSENRFCLGIGTGRPAGDAKTTINSMLERLESTKLGLKELIARTNGIKVPETYVATLRKGIASAVAGRSDGILLNFCSPDHVRVVVTTIRQHRGRPPKVSCYMKLFFARDKSKAIQMMVREFDNYDRIPSYHGMFVTMGVSTEISKAKESAASGATSVDEKLLEISLANPTEDELTKYVDRFREAGVDMPCLYPYFESAEDESYKERNVTEIIGLLR